jgi:hypothetical protein
MAHSLRKDSPSFFESLTLDVAGSGPANAISLAMGGVSLAKPNQGHLKSLLSQSSPFNKSTYGLRTHRLKLHRPRQKDAEHVS